MSRTNEDINDIISSAVQARVEASVMEAMSSNGAMQAIVSAALSEQVQVGNSYGPKVPLLTALVQGTIKEQAKQVVAEEVKSMSAEIRGEVRKALKKSVGVIADSLVDGFVASAEGRYPSIEVNFRGRD